MPAKAHVSDHSVPEKKMNIYFQNIHSHAQIIHFLPHEKTVIHF